MSHIDTGGGSGNRRANLELNLVPFIDLMSVLITFLLITAVWSQVSMMQIGSSIYGKKQNDQTAQEPPPDADVVLRLDIKPDRYVLTIGKNEIPIVKAGGDYDQEMLLSQLEVAKRKYPAKVDAVVTMNDELAYEHLVHGMDRLLQAGFSQISVATAAAK